MQWPPALIGKLAIVLGAMTLVVPSFAQHLTYDEWVQGSHRDARLAPRYGDVHKNAKQLASDAEFRKLMLALDSIPRNCSQQLVLHGFTELQKGDLTAAMFRFNQAFLMDSTDTDIYWGYGAFFMALDRPTMAHTMFRAGLSLDSTNTHLLMGESTAYLAERHAVVSDTSQADELARRALAMLQQAERHDAKGGEVHYRLSICYDLLGQPQEACTHFAKARHIGYTGPDVGFAQRMKDLCRTSDQ